MSILYLESIKQSAHVILWCHTLINLCVSAWYGWTCACLAMKLNIDQAIVNQDEFGVTVKLTNHIIFLNMWALFSLNLSWISLYVGPPSSENKICFEVICKMYSKGHSSVYSLACFLVLFPHGLHLPQFSEPPEIFVVDQLEFGHIYCHSEPAMEPSSKPSQNWPQPLALGADYTSQAPDAEEHHSGGFLSCPWCNVLHQPPEHHPSSGRTVPDLFVPIFHDHLRSLTCPALSITLTCLQLPHLQDTIYTHCFPHCCLDSVMLQYVVVIVFLHLS